MKKGIHIQSGEDYEALIKNLNGGRYQLRLYVVGSTPQSALAIKNIKTISEEFLKGRYVLKVFDLYQPPHLAKGEQIIAAPTLIKRLPHPLRRIIGDLSNKEKVLTGLDLKFCE